MTLFGERKQRRERRNRARGKGNVPKRRRKEVRLQQEGKGEQGALGCHVQVRPVTTVHSPFPCCGRSSENAARSRARSSSTLHWPNSRGHAPEHNVQAPSVGWCHRLSPLPPWPSAPSALSCPERPQHKDLQEALRVSGACWRPHPFETE